MIKLFKTTSPQKLCYLVASNCMITNGNPLVMVNGRKKELD